MVSIGRSGVLALLTFVMGRQFPGGGFPGMCAGGDQKKPKSRAPGRPRISGGAEPWSEVFDGSDLPARGRCL